MSRWGRSSLVGVFVLYSLGLVLGTLRAASLALPKSSDIIAPIGPVQNRFTDLTWTQQLVNYRRQVRESGRCDLFRATFLVHFATRHVEQREIAFSENWLQYLVGYVYRPLRQTQNTDLLIRGRFANCSDRCQILKSIAESAGRECRFVGLNGHVLLEVRGRRGWATCDPDYNVVYLCSAEELARPESEEMIRRRLSPWYPKEIVNRYVEIVQSRDDNRTLPIGSPLSPKLFVAERILGWLSWIIPVACIAVGSARILRCLSPRG